MSPNHYLDEANGNYSNVIWIPSQTIAAQTLEVFVVHTPAFEENHIKPICNYDNRIQKDNLGINSIKLDCLNQFYELRLNDQTVNSDVFYTKSYKTNQNGLKHFIPIDSLDRGKHTLKLYYNFYNKGKDSIYSRLQSKIEFYKESPKIED
jgi:ASC-1-like (ASCH) protein